VILGLLTTIAVLAAAPPRWRLPRFQARPGRRWSRRPEARRARELEWLEAVVAELRAGRDPTAALLAAGGDDVAPAAYAAARTWGDVVVGLHTDGRSSSTVRAAGACWEVAAGSGAGLAQSLLVLADSVRESQRLHRELVSATAEPRATAAVLVALPAVGLAFGALLGADPLSWLLGTTPGRAVLLAGVVLEAAGALWSWRLLRTWGAAL
jgi:tight adherence protein B